MAFKMNRPVIKGTPIHKASIAKARSESIVSQARTQADSSLVSAGQVLGESYIPAAIDFSIDMPDYELGEREPKTPKKPKGKKPKTIKVEDPTGKPEATLKGTTKQAVDGTGPKTDAGKGYIQPKRKKIRVMTPEELNDNRREEKEVTKIEPRSIRKLPTSKRKVELQKATRTVQTKKSVDKFEVAAEKAGLPITTLEEYERAERLLVYDEELDTWREKVGTGKPTEVIVGEADDFTGDSGSSDDQYRTMQKAGLDYGVGGLDMVSDGKGGYVPKEGAVSVSGDTWDAKLGGWRDDAREQYYGPKGQKISKEMSDKLSDQQQRKADKIQEAKEKKKIKDAKNVKIRERNKRIADAKKFYGKDVKLTQIRLDAYNESVKRQEAELNNTPSEIPEQDDPEPREIAAQEKRDLNSNTPQNAPDQPKKEAPKVSSGKQKRLDLKYRLAGPSVRANMEADGYVPSESKSAMLMRDNRIYRNARADGPVRRNMIKSGYTPE